MTEEMTIALWRIGVALLWGALLYIILTSNNGDGGLYG